MRRFPMSRWCPSALGFVSVVVYALRASLASADDAPVPAAPPAPTVAPPSAAPSDDAPAEHGHGTSAKDVRYLDAHADRVIFGSTAETHPKGTFFFTDYEIFLLQFGYAVTDELQLSLTGLPPIVKDQPYWFDLGLKLNLVRGDVFRAALTGAFDVVTTGGSGTSTGPYFGGRAGAVAQICFESTCGSSVSLNFGTVLTSGVNQVLPIYGAAGFVAKLSPLVSLLAEPELLGAFGTGANNFSAGAFFAFGYGVRLSGKHFGVDLTLIKPVAVTTGSINDPLILGYPFVAFTYRTDGDARDARDQAGRGVGGMASGAGPRRF